MDYENTGRNDHTADPYARGATNFTAIDILLNPVGAHSLVCFCYFKPLQRVPGARECVDSEYLALTH